MSWNKPNFNSRPNLVEIAGDKLLPFVEAVKKIDERAKYNPMGRRKPIAGYRFYDCEECGHLGKEKTRDCHSPSHEICEMCHSEAPIIRHEEHPEWPVDKSGNLI